MTNEERFCSEPLAFPRSPSRVVLVRHVARDNSLSWTAEMEIDGRVWTLDCGHAHRSPKLALKCASALARRYADLAEWETFLVDRQNEVIEFRRVEIVEEGGRRGARTWTQRISPSARILTVLDAETVRAQLTTARKVS